MLLFKNSNCNDVKEYIKINYYCRDEHKLIEHICKHIDTHIFKLGEDEQIDNLMKFIL